MRTHRSMLKACLHRHIYSYICMHTCNNCRQKYITCMHVHKEYILTGVPNWMQFSSVRTKSESESLTTCRLLAFSMFLIHLLAWPCGSINRGHRRELLKMKRILSQVMTDTNPTIFLISDITSVECLEEYLKLSSRPLESKNTFILFLLPLFHHPHPIAWVHISPLSTKSQNSFLSYAKNNMKFF